MQAKWPIRQVIPVSVAGSDYEYFYSPLEGISVHSRVTPSIRTWVERGERGNLRVKCPAQEHSAVSLALVIARIRTTQSRAH